RYPAAVLEAAVKELQGRLDEGTVYGRAGYLLREDANPPDKGQRPRLLETVVRWTAVEFDGRQVLLEGIIVETTDGKDALAVMDAGILPGVSQRANGRSRLISEGKRKVEEVEELHIV